MITVTTRYNKEVRIYRISSCWFGAYATDGWNFTSIKYTERTPRIAAMTDRTTARVDHFDVGWIDTSPSTLTGCNDCLHYDVDGDLMRDLDNAGRIVPFADDVCSRIWYNDAYNNTYTYVIGAPGLEKSFPKYARWIKTTQRKNGTLYRLYTCLDSFTVSSGEDAFYIKGRYTYVVTPNDKGPSKDIIAQYEAEVTNRIRYTDSTLEYRKAVASSTIKPPTAPSIYYALRPDAPIFDYVEMLLRDEGGEWGDLTSDAAESVRLTNSNTWLSLFKLANLPSLASGLTKLFAAEAYKSSHALIKAASDTYLAYHYGLRLTVRNMKDFCDGVNKIDLDRFTQTAGSEKEFSLELPGRPGTMIHIQRRAKLILDSYTREQYTIVENMKKMARAFFELDLTPSFENVWDMIPLSFVVDWVFPIGDAFERAENINYVKTLHFRRCFYSEKWNWSYHDDFMTDSGYHYHGDLDFRFYHRDCRPSCIIPSFGVDHPHKDATKHWLEATALFLSLRG